MKCMPMISNTWVFPNYETLHKSTNEIYGLVYNDEFEYNATP